MIHDYLKKSIMNKVRKSMDGDLVLSCQAKILDSFLLSVYNAHVEEKGMNLSQWQQLILMTGSGSAAFMRCTAPS
jgi:4-diphosphocytidyl-2C-methyl-D-erythritol kinase